MRNANIFLSLCLALTLLVLTGCGGGTGAVAVEGTVTWNGEPVPGLVVEFTPTQGNRPSQGFTDEDGHFVLNYTIKERGAEIGHHNVTFAWVDQKEGDKPSEAVKEILKLHGAKGKPISIEVTGKTEDLVIALPQA